MAPSANALKTAKAAFPLVVPLSISAINSEILHLKFTITGSLGFRSSSAERMTDLIVSSSSNSTLCPDYVIRQRISREHYQQ
jgi:hypothetical protein